MVTAPQNLFAKLSPGTLKNKNMFYNLKESRVPIRDGFVHYAAFGKGEKPLVILPGLTLRDVKGAGAGLALMYRIFSKDFRVYVLDKNTSIKEKCTVRDLANDTMETMRTLGISNADVFGVSLGGMIAQALAIESPELVKRLVLGVTLSRTNDTVERVIKQWVEFVERGEFDGIVRDMLTIMYSKDYAKRYGWMFPILAKFSVPKDKERFIRLAKSTLTCDFYDDLDRINCKTLVLGGGKDQIVTGEASIEIAQKLGCEIHMYEKLGHSAYDEAKDFNARIYRFLTE